MKNNINSRLAAIEKAISINKKVLSVDEACNYLGLTKGYLYKLTSAGIIPFSKPNGKKIFFDRDKLEEWLLRNPSKTVHQLENEAQTHISINN